MRKTALVAASVAAFLAGCVQGRWPAGPGYNAYNNYPGTYAPPAWQSYPKGQPTPSVVRPQGPGNSAAATPPAFAAAPVAEAGATDADKKSDSPASAEDAGYLAGGKGIYKTGAVPRSDRGTDDAKAQ